MANFISAWIYGYQGNPDYATPYGVSVGFPVDKINLRGLPIPIQYQGVNCNSIIEVLIAEPPYPTYYSSDSITTLVTAANAGGSSPSPTPSTYSVVTVFTTYNATATSGNLIILCDTTGGAFNVNLPTAVGNTAMFTIKKIAGVSNVTADGSGSETIDGGTTANIVVVYESITLISDNSNWHII